MDLVQNYPQTQPHPTPKICDNPHSFKIIFKIMGGVGKSCRQMIDSVHQKHYS